MTRLTPLQLVKLTMSGVLVYGAFSAMLLFLPVVSHRRFLYAALIPMLMGMTLILGSDLAIRRGLYRQSYTQEQLELVKCWVNQGLFRWFIKASIGCGIAGTLYSALTGFHLALFFICLIIFSISLSTTQKKIVDTVEPQAPLVIPSRTVRTLSSDHWAHTTKQVQPSRD